MIPASITRAHLEAEMALKTPSIPKIGRLYQQMDTRQPYELSLQQRIYGL